MKYFRIDALEALVIVWILCLAVFTMVFASTGPGRGRPPECQEECLKRHVEKMKGLAERLRRDGNKMQYQEDVQILGLEYETCLDNCRQLYPVK